MKIKNWDKWQSYRSDRGTPPWIKVHRNLFSNPEWFDLTDSEKGQLVSIWILAADKKGDVPDDPRKIQKMCGLDDEPNINKFMELGFICQCDATVTPKGSQSDPPETDKSRVDKTRGRQEADKKRLETEDKKHRSIKIDVRDKNPTLDEQLKSVSGIDVSAIEKYINYRKEAKFKKLTKSGLLLAAKNLVKYGGNFGQHEIVEQSMANGWQGLFELKNQKTGLPMTQREKDKAKFYEDIETYEKSSTAIDGECTHVSE